MADVALDVSFGQARQTLHQADLASLVRLDNGRPTSLDTGALQALAARLAGEWDQPVRNARFAWNGGNLSAIVDSQEGRTLDQAGAAAAIAQALLRGESSVSLPGSLVQPQVSSDNPQALGITDNLDRGSTSFAGSVPEKAHNIRLAAERLNGVVVPPGGTFSFNAEVGPTTLESGYEWGFGIEAGAAGARTVPSVAGGICQVATTLFQRVFWSGLPLVERHWHLYWIPAYASHGLVGLDATVDSDSGLDFQWSNPTDGYILVQTATDESNVYFGLYGKRRDWTVKVDEPVITNRVPPDTDPVAEVEPSLPWGRIQPVEVAREGFDVAITRTVTREDGQARALTVKSSYEPSRTVTLVGTKGKPAGADVEAVLARVAPPRPAPVPSPSPSVLANAPVAGPAGVSTEQPAPATPAATPTPAAPPTSTPPPTPVATPTAPIAATSPPATATPTARPTAPTTPTRAPGTPTAVVAPAARTPTATAPRSR
jgi:vancomycin resistance protein YoaR